VVKAEGQVEVKERGEARIQRGHPWIFRSDIGKVKDAPPGAVVRVVGGRGRPLGFAFYSSRSEIRLRMISRAATLPETFLADRLRAAVAWRAAIAEGAEACRLVHGEGDGLPSLIADRYGAHLVVQTLSQATERLKPQIVEELVRLTGAAGVLERNDPRVRELEGLERRVSLLHGEVPDVVEVKEGDVKLRADLWKGQKTGLFLDQRENHLRARRYARGKVLDGFAYDGGFALQLASAADEVLAIDVSAEAVGRVRENAARNGLANVTAQEGNVFDVLRELEAQGRRFDTIVLDPPAFAKSRDAVDGAARGYKEINLRALKLLSPGGCLVTCSCSYHIHEADFESILEAAAVDAGVTATIVEKRRQSRDHPVVLGVPETYYLKCFVLRRLE
jgi:23S rRNA (cytosine1962-C5)-methyltransferase